MSFMLDKRALGSGGRLEDYFAALDIGIPREKWMVGAGSRKEGPSAGGNYFQAPIDRIKKGFRRFGFSEGSPCFAKPLVPQFVESFLNPLNPRLKNSPNIPEYPTPAITSASDVPQ
jgi:hypothetical protein